jgi:hypothetical protein
MPLLLQPTHLQAAELITLALTLPLLLHGRPTCRPPQLSHLQATELITLALTLPLLLHSLPTCRPPQLSHLQAAELITLALPLTLDLNIAVTLTLADEQYMLMRS